MLFLEDIICVQGDLIISWKKFFLREIILALRIFSVSELKQSWYAIPGSYPVFEQEIVRLAHLWSMMSEASIRKHKGWDWNNLKVRYSFSSYMISLHRLFWVSLQHEGGRDGGMEGVKVIRKLFSVRFAVFSVLRQSVINFCPASRE